MTTIGQHISTGNNGLLSDTTDGFSALIAADPAATWNSATNTVEEAVAPTCASISPRLVGIAVFDVERYQFDEGQQRLVGVLRWWPRAQVVNIIGFFLESTRGLAKPRICREASWAGLTRQSSLSVASSSRSSDHFGAVTSQRL